MKRAIERLRQGVCGLAVAGALGLGATQAFAGPASAQAAPSCDTACSRVCQAAGFVGGFCPDGGGCSCYL
jgi:hypothetical protein